MKRSAAWASKSLLEEFLFRPPPRPQNSMGIKRATDPQLQEVFSPQSNRFYEIFA